MSKITPKITPENTLIIVALESELPRQHLPEWRVIYCGVGKVNATLEATKNILQFQPDIVLNYGSAGSLNPTLSGLVEAGQFLQHDMDVRALGFALGQTPFEEGGIALSFGYQGVICASGDHFVTSPPELPTDLVDMEAYALAKTARHFACDFRAFKYISDQADGDAATDWQENQRLGAALFVELLENLSGGDTRT